MGYYSGIDVGNKETSICMIDQRRQVQAEETVETTAAGLRKVFKGRKKLTCVVEAAPLAEWVCTEVEKYGHEVTIVCPRKAKLALSAVSKKKTDKRDAHALAELCRSGWYEAVHRKSAEAREMRSFVQARKQLVQCGTALASSIRGLLRAHGVKLEAGSDDVSFGEKVQRAMKELPALAQQGIHELLIAFEQVYEQQRKLYRQLNKLTKQSELTKRLQTIPGVGPATVAVFVATIDDPKRFPDAEKVVSYVGLCPQVYQSGETEFRGRITKAGDKTLRWLLVEAAHVLLSRSKTPCDLTRWGLALQAKKGIGKARVAVARRLCTIMWKMWMDGTEFQSEEVVAEAA